MKGDLTVVIPTLNEEEAIGGVIEELREEGYEDILVVDGHSEDRTVEVAEENGAETIYQRGEGKANAVKTAIEYVDTPFLVVMDGDHTYPPSEIVHLLGEATDYNHVIGKRRDNISLLHRLGNLGVTTVFNVLMGTRFEDILSGMYLLRTERARGLEFPFEDFECESIICAQLNGEITEVPIDYRERVGERKLSGVKDLAKILFATILLSRKYGNPSLLALVATLMMSILGVGAAAIIAAPTLFR